MDRRIRVSIQKNVGVGGRRSTRIGPGLSSSQPTYLYNKYSPGGGGVGASSVANRRAKNRIATNCNTNQKCFPCYTTLGQYSNYTHNPNGFVFCPPLAIAPSSVVSSSVAPSSVVPSSPSCASLVSGNVSANMNTSGMTALIFTGLTFPNDDGYAYLPFTGMDFYFFGTNYGNSDGTTPSTSIYMCTNYAFGFGQGFFNFNNWPANQPAILFDFFDSANFASYVSPPQNGIISGVKYVRIVATGTDYVSNSINDPTVKKAYEIYYVRDNCFQYMQFNCSVEDAVGFDRSQYVSVSNITNGTTFQNTFGAFGANPSNTEGPQAGNSYVIKSDLNGNNWEFFQNTHLVL